GLAPREPEALGLVALMELQAARFPARTGAAGEAIPLLEQDRSRWDFVLIGRGLKGQKRWAGRSALTRCRLQSPPATLAPERPSRPTGSESPLSTTASQRSPALR